ncbi:MAG: PD-(D/E)XK nuclease family protein [Lewinellaceae bacterium]|nr:PD-(D/E)XK nuclease family protein [Lewinellaceae bacterium]
MFEIHLSSTFDGPVFSSHKAELAGQYYCGPKKLLQWLEKQYGRDGMPSNTDYLRIELYRQSLAQAAAGDDARFFKDAMDADRYATAQVLLEWRDDLLLAGWDFQPVPDLPLRLAHLATVEAIFKQKITTPEHNWICQGFADRFSAILALAKAHTLPISRVVCHSPQQLLPIALQRLMAVWENQGVAVETTAVAATAMEDTDLGRLQRAVLGEKQEQCAPTDDGSLVLLRARRDSDAAPWIAHLIAQNPGFHPLLLAPEMNRSLEQSMVQVGLPSTGILSASLARPSLQVLKLAPAFLWEPVDVFKIMEFVTLPLKPLEDGLAQAVARVMAEKPGLFSDNWFAAVLGYLESEAADQEASRQYDFWFKRKRYPIDALAPKADVIAIYAYLQQWSREEYRALGSKNASLLVLSEQARRIVALLEALPETRIGYLELERIVRTIYEPSPFQMSAAAARHLPFVHEKGAIAGNTDALLWWNCVYDTPVLPTDRWRPEEREWLAEQGVQPVLPSALGQLEWWNSKIPVCRASRQLVLVLPDFSEGQEQQPNLLMSDLEACFGDLSGITYHLDEATDRERLARHFVLPAAKAIAANEQTQTPAWLQLEHPDRLPESAYETPTNLESLFYYPYLWFFKQKIKINPVSLYRIAADRSLLGNLAHRFFELMLKEPVADWDRQRCAQWIQQQSYTLLEKEGATLLLYGREPERNTFLRKLEQAAWSPISLLRNNRSTVLGTEVSLEGEFAGQPLRARADLLLERGQERAIIDLKWSGSSRRKAMIRNEEDLQLTLYAALLSQQGGNWPHTGYFILEEGKMIARNKAAFVEADVPGEGADDHEAIAKVILDRMEKTLVWRMEQLQKGQLEMRTSHNIAELDELYAAASLDLLEMKHESARFDDFRGLITG